MENLNPWQIFAVVIGAILAVAGFINTVGSAVEKMTKVVDAAKAPGEEQNAILDDHEARLKKVEAYIRQEGERLELIEEGNRVTQRAILALLDHGIDGNNVKQMQDAKDALQEHLISR